MFREVSSHNQSESQPSQAVRDEAAKIIQTLDGRINSPWLIDNPEHDQDRARQVREMLIKDSQTLSPKDMKDLILTVMSGEDKKRGYDLELYGHSTDDINSLKAKIAEERTNLLVTERNCTKEERAAALKEFDQDHAQQLASYQSELILELTHHSAPSEYGEKPRSPGATIEVAACPWAHGLPEFKITDQSK